MGYRTRSSLGKWVDGGRQLSDPDPSHGVHNTLSFISEAVSFLGLVPLPFLCFRESLLDSCSLSFLLLEICLHSVTILAPSYLVSRSTPLKIFPLSPKGWASIHSDAPLTSASEGDHHSPSPASTSCASQILYHKFCPGSTGRLSLHPFPSSSRKASK